MFGSLGIWEIVFIVVLGLLIFGPKKLPEVSRTIGRALGELRRSAEDFQRTVEREAADVQDAVRPVARGIVDDATGVVDEESLADPESTTPAERRTDS